MGKLLPHKVFIKSTAVWLHIKTNLSRFSLQSSLNRMSDTHTHTHATMTIIVNNKIISIINVVFALSPRSISPFFKRSPSPHQPQSSTAVIKRDREIKRMRASTCVGSTWERARERLTDARQRPFQLSSSFIGDVFNWSFVRIFNGGARTACLRSFISPYKVRAIICQGYYSE